MRFCYAIEVPKGLTCVQDSSCAHVTSVACPI